MAHRILLQSRTSTRAAQLGITAAAYAALDLLPGIARHAIHARLATTRLTVLFRITRLRNRCADWARSNGGAGNRAALGLGTTVLHAALHLLLLLTKTALLT